MSFPSERVLGNRFAFWRQNIVLNDGLQRRGLQGLCFSHTSISAMPIDFYAWGNPDFLR